LRKGEIHTGRDRRVADAPPATGGEGTASGQKMGGLRKGEGYVKNPAQGKETVTHDGAP